MTSGFSKAGLERLHEVMTAHVEAGAVPGLVTLVSRRGEVHVDAIGVKDAEGADPMQRDTIFRISSMTKPVTAVAAMILVEEGKLRLDDAVDHLLPELADRQVLARLDAPLDDTVPADRPITARDLLTFTFGLGLVMAMPGTYPIQAAMDGLGQGPPDPSIPPGPDAWIARLGELPLIHQPGERWMYNTGSDVLGVLIGRAAGQPFDAFLRDRIFEPLGMDDTDFSVPAGKIDRLATSYGTDFETGALQLNDAAAGGQWSEPPAFPSGAGGLVSTVDDYLAFAQMLLHDGTHGAERILSRSSVELMTTDHLTPGEKEGGLVPGYWDSHGWGFGVSVVTRRHDLESIGAYGWDGGLGTIWRNDPREELVALLMTQKAWTSPNPPDACRDFLTSSYAAIDD